jgi:hypothetical protein
MKTVVINKIEDGVPPPTGNGFDIYQYRRIGVDNIYDTGLEISLPKDMTLEIEPEEGIIIRGWTLSWGKIWDSHGDFIDTNRLVVEVKSKEPFQKIGKVWIVKREIEKIRFMQTAKEGGRVIRGEGKVVNIEPNPEGGD